jgi:hypothetical protein
MKGTDQLSLLSLVADKPRQTAPEQVRQPQQECLARDDNEPPPSPLAHPSNRLLIELNRQWRIVDDHLQYILQFRKGTPRSKATGWSSRSFCRTRAALLRCIRDYCGLVDKIAVGRIRVLPEWHIDQQTSSADENSTD